ncbi:MAG TPA: hypothetical protein VMR21_14155, partial [Vicinamibacteria bacterium]|nr:hypothetical protein [Vicinamibacteria bacterium]
VSALSLLSLMLWFDGMRILHEPLYLVPVLVSAWLVSPPARPRAGLAAGALSAGAFLIKQYGGFGLWGLLGHALAGGPGRLRRVGWIVAGSGLGFAALAGALVLGGVDPLGFARALAPDAPRTYQLVFLHAFLRACPIVLPALAVPLLPGAWSRPLVRLAACFLLASCLPLLLRQHQYYFLNLCPWLFVLFAVGVEHVPRAARAAAVYVGLALLVSMPLRGAMRAAAVIEADWRADQARRAHLMTILWPAEKRTLFFVDPALQHLTHYRSADEAQVGYRYIPDLSAERLRVGFARAEGAWVDRGMFANRPNATLEAAGSSLRGELEKNGFAPQLVLEDRFQLWTKRPLSRREKHAAGGVSVEDIDTGPR